MGLNHFFKFATSAVLKSLCCFAFLISGITTSAFAAQPLLSQWSKKPVPVTKVSYTCPDIAHIAPDLVTNTFYRLDDPTHSIVDPVRMEAYRKSSDGVKQVGLAVVHAADTYRTTGSREAAQCAIAQIASLAEENALNGKMSSNQAYYVQGWVVGAIAIAYLKVQGAGLATPEQNSKIAEWMHNVGQQTRAYYDSHKEITHSDAQNNHLYWAGVELAAIAVVAQNKSDFDWAIAAYDNGVNQIRPNGELPLEMARGQRALHYHLYALAPLAFLAEFGEVNHVDLYALANGAIHRLVNFSVNGLIDPSPFAKATGVRQEVPKVVTGDQIGWAPPYLRRFPNPVLQRFADNAPDMRVYYLGGLPPAQ
jgi:poly(beta-D-mannuronate) lyase